MPARPKEPGPTSRRAAANLRRIRDERGLTTRALEKNTALLGWRIPANSITRTEAGERRMDVDDLVTLSVLLTVSPNTLLLPHVTSGHPRELRAQTELLPDLTAAAGRVWAWGCGEARLEPTSDAVDMVTRSTVVA